MFQLDVRGPPIYSTSKVGALQLLLQAELNPCLVRHIISSKMM